MPKNNALAMDHPGVAAEGDGSHVHDILESLQAGEGELLHEFVRAARAIRYGSITLTLHEGRIVEIHKTERIRRNGNKKNSNHAVHE